MLYRVHISFFIPQHTASLPTVIRLPEPLVGATIGNSHTVLQMRSGKLMSMGNNGRYQTGIGEEDSAVETYTYIDS